jgi:pectate lyase
VISFGIAGTLELASPLSIPSNKTVDGSGVSVTIQTNGNEFTPVIVDNAHDVTLRNLRVRPGPSADGDIGDNIDGIMVRDSQRVTIDHCSVSWAVDENISIIRSTGVIVQDSIVSEGLYNSTNSKGPHSCGVLIADGDCSAVVCRCLFAHNDYRNPVSNGRSDTVNNVIYGAQEGGTHYNDEYGASHNNYIGNVLLFTGTQIKAAVNWVRTYGADDVRVYRSDNLADGLAESFYVRQDGAPNMSTDLAHYLVDTPYPMLYTGEIMPAADVLAYVLANAGASPRDAVDTRIVSQVTNRTGGFVDTPPA